MKKIPATVFMVVLLLLCFSTARAQGFPWDDSSVARFKS